MPRRAKARQTKQERKRKTMAKYTAIGGQALIEGILMKSPEKTALAVRTPDGGIDITYMDGQDIRKKYPILRLPVLRGIASFISSMSQGYKAMMISADKSGFTSIEEEEEKKRREEKLKKKGKTVEDAKKQDSLFMNIVMGIGAVLGVALSVVLFMLIPRLFVGGLEWLFHIKGGFSEIVRASIEQLLKLAVFVLYIWLVSFVKDIRRVFMYHGAEHKTIFCYEKGLELTVENVKKQRRFHPRCGTSFLILMILVSLVFSTVVQLIFPGVYSNAGLWVAVKILMIPIICGAGFEVLRVCGKYDNLFTRIVSAPGLWIQRITTKEPDDGMMEVAIAALRACEPSVPDVDRSIDNEKLRTETAEEKTEGEAEKDNATDDI